MGTDFFDNDLLQPDETELGNKREEKEDRVLDQTSADARVSRMTRYKEDVTDQVAGAVKEIEQLRMKRESLKKEKSALETLTWKQEEYEHGKKDIMDKMGRSIVLAEREEVLSMRMAELLSETRSRFKETLSRLRAIDESTWSDDNFQTELYNALALVEDATTEYKKALGKIDAANWHNGTPEKNQSDVPGELTREQAIKKGFGFWFKIGLAITLPIMVVLAIFFVIWLFVMGIV